MRSQFLHGKKFWKDFVSVHLLLGYYRLFTLFKLSYLQMSVRLLLYSIIFLYTNSVYFYKVYSKFLQIIRLFIYLKLNLAHTILRINNLT